MTAVRNARGRFAREVSIYEVTVWDMADGDIVKKLWEASQGELDDIQDRYGDDPRYSVQVEWLRDEFEE
jgi:hypothetical protein